MTISEESLKIRLQAYPYLRRTLGDQWITEQDQVDPVKSDFPLARWLRLDGFEAELATLNAILARLDRVPGIAHRRQRMRADAPALMETLTELYFSAWLLEEGYAFLWPKQGPDCLINVDAGTTLPVEITTPRIGAWIDDLVERLHFVALRMHYSVEIEFALELLPDPSKSPKVVAAIVGDALSSLAPPDLDTGGETRVAAIQNHPEYRVCITWTPSAHPGVVAVTSPGPTSPYSLYWLVISAAQGKARQLPEDRAGVLLIGTEQLPKHQQWSFDIKLRRRDSGEASFDWTTLPNQVKYVIFYTFELKRLDPFQVTWIRNPMSSLAESAGTLELLRKLAPDPL